MTQREVSAPKRARAAVPAPKRLSAPDCRLRLPRPRCVAFGERASRDHLGLDGCAAAPDDVGFHREVFGQAELIDATRGVAIALLDALPEFAIVLAGEGRAIFLTLVLEDRHLLRAQLVLGERDQNVGFRDLPLLPGAAVVPHLRRRTGILEKSLLHGLETHAVGAVRIG